MIKQRNYYKKYKTYYFFLFTYAAIGIASIIYYSYLGLAYLYNKRIHEESQLLNIKTSWVFRLSKQHNVILNLSLLKIKDIFALINSIDDKLDKLNVKNKIKIILLVNISHDQYSNSIIAYCNELNIQLINITTKNIISLSALDNLVSYYCINLGLNITFPQFTFKSDEDDLMDKLTVNLMILNKISNLFCNNYKKSALITIDSDNIFNLFDLVGTIDNLFSNEVVKFYNNAFKQLEINTRLKIIFKTWSLKQLDVPFKNIINNIASIKNMVVKKNESNLVNNDLMNNINQYNDKIWKVLVDEVGSSIISILNKYII